MVCVQTRALMIILQKMQIYEGYVSILKFFFGSTAAQKIMAAKKQAALLASCKSLPNSPSHSGGSTPVSGVFPGQVKLSICSTLSEKMACAFSYLVNFIFYSSVRLFLKAVGMLL